MRQLTKREYTLARTLVRLGHIHRLPFDVRCPMELVAEAARGSDRLEQRASWAKIYADCGDPKAGTKALRSCPLVGSGVPPGSLMFEPGPSFYETPLSLPYQEAPALDYSTLEARVLAYLVTEVTVEGWTISINMPERRGSFERDRDGHGGGLWFYIEEPIELADYDGTVALPRPVFAQLKAWGVVMDETFDPDYEVQP